jgi:hypothetical protein
MSRRAHARSPEGARTDTRITRRQGPAPFGLRFHCPHRLSQNLRRYACNCSCLGCSVEFECATITVSKQAITAAANTTKAGHILGTKSVREAPILS